MRFNQCFLFVPTVLLLPSPPHHLGPSKARAETGVVGGGEGQERRPLIWFRYGFGAPCALPVVLVDIVSCGVHRTLLGTPICWSQAVGSLTNPPQIPSTLHCWPLLTPGWGHSCGGRSFEKMLRLTLSTLTLSLGSSSW